MLSTSALWFKLWNGESENREIRELGNHKLNNMFIICSYLRFVVNFHRWLLGD